MEIYFWRKLIKYNSTKYSVFFENPFICHMLWNVQKSYFKLFLSKTMTFPCVSMVIFFTFMSVIQSHKEPHTNISVAQKRNPIEFWSYRNTVMRENWYVAWPRMMTITSLSGLGSSFLGIHRNKKATEIKKILVFFFLLLLFWKESVILFSWNFYFWPYCFISMSCGS